MIVGAFGAYYLIELIKKQKRLLKISLAVGFSLAYLFVFGLFWDRYFVHAPIENSEFWQYGYKEAVQFVAQRKDDYEKVVFTNKYGQPYIYYLFYNRYPPSKYQQEDNFVPHPEGDVGSVGQLENIEFRNLYWPRDRFEPGVLYVGATWELPQQDLDPQQAKVLKEIYFLNGKLAFRIVETLKK
jgi:hypothetical protein